MPDVQDIVAEVLRDDEYVLGTFGDTGPQGEKGDQGEEGPQGPAGPSNVLSIGTVVRGDDAAASITGTSPNQILNLTLPKGDQGIQGPEGPTGFAPIANVTKSGDTVTISITDKNGTTTESLITSYQEPILSYKWSDHLLNDISWLRADTFSWQSGATYISTYQHLVDDIQGKTAQTETIGNYTVTYYLADDGHKVVLADQENTVANIYNDTGVAWYFILDTTNIRFKLPRENAKIHGELIESIHDGAKVCRTYEDGWCEQFGLTTTPASNACSGTFTKSFINTDYFVTVMGQARSGWMGILSKTTTGFTCRIEDGGGQPSMFYACGYVDTPTNPYQITKYLYFYVGNFSQSATEQTAGLNSELFNNKADRNLSNVTGTSGFRKLISANKIGNAWYKVYAEYDPSTGAFLGNWCEQGDTVTRAAATAQTITFPLPFADTSYTLIQNYQGGTANGNTGENENGYFDKTTTGFTKKSTVALTYITEFAYVAYGYIS